MSGITSYVHIDAHGAYLNGENFCVFNPESEHHWFKQIYTNLGLSYSKFHKMDALAQAGFLAVELLKRSCANALVNYQDDEIALFFGNCASSLDTDLKFENSYLDQGAPSPALFVYTLPNIVLGEIAIANKWYGENMFVVLPAFASDTFVQYTQILLDNGSKAVIGGWLEVVGDVVDVFVFLVEEKGILWDEETLNDYRLKNTN
jgi:hypothetical protein